MKHRLFLSMTIVVIGTHRWIVFAGDAADDLDIWTMNPEGSGATNVRNAAGAPTTQGG
jgi:Tol biopolymer transport system component